MIGGGPAGSAAAIALRRLGITCTVLHKSKPIPFKPGESLAPNACGVLQALGVEHLLQDATHLAYTGNITVWGSQKPVLRHFFAEPFGNGLHLDRLLFEAQLKDEAIAQGAGWLEGWQFTSLFCRQGVLHVHGTDAYGGHVVMQSAYVLDCTGRASAVARKLGIKRQVLDNLTAYCFVLEMPASFFHGISYIEAVADGWWYAAPLPQNRLVVNFMSDSDLHIVDGRSLKQWLLQKLKGTQHIQHLLQIQDSSELKYVQVKTATTSLLQQPAGDKWLAVGDALCTYDPITSFGITIAMAGGRQAAVAVSKYLSGDTHAITEYIAIQQDTFNKSIAMLQYYYCLENRWVDHPFWQRRRFDSIDSLY